jgi:hypothetical protein
LQTCGKGPLHVCDFVLHDWLVPRHVCALDPTHCAPVQVAATTPLQTPADPLHCAGKAPVHAPATRPLQVGTLLHAPAVLLTQAPAKALHVWATRLLQVCGLSGPVCGHDGLVGSHQMTFSFS